MEKKRRSNLFELVSCSRWLLLTKARVGGSLHITIIYLDYLNRSSVLMEGINGVRGLVKLKRRQDKLCLGTLIKQSAKRDGPDLVLLA